jgi:hypothetical protein
MIVIALERVVVQSVFDLSNNLARIMDVILYHEIVLGLVRLDCTSPY